VLVQPPDEQSHHEHCQHERDDHAHADEHIGKNNTGFVSQRLGSPYVSGRSRHWIKSKNPAAPAVKREAEEDWGAKRWR
jgi:ATP-dependent DNA ligase